MSVLINMEMPQNCHECPCCETWMTESDTVSVDCLAIDKNILELEYERSNEAYEVTVKGRQDWCPLVEMPDNRWIPIKSRPMDDEEREYYSERIGYVLSDDDAVIYDSCLPDDGQNVLVCYEWGGVSVEHFCNDEHGCYFEENGDMDGIVAWMPLPEPYKEEEGE